MIELAVLALGLIVKEQLAMNISGKGFATLQERKFKVTHPLMRMSSSSQIISWTTSAASPTALASKLSSPGKENIKC